MIYSAARAPQSVSETVTSRALPQNVIAENRCCHFLASKYANHSNVKWVARVPRRM